MSRVEFVIARFNESLDWLAGVPRHVAVRVYNKGPFAEYLGLRVVAPQAVRIWLPNRGREAGTYLHHICDRYDYLAEVTVFLQGYPHAHSDLLPTEEHELNGQPYRCLARCAITDDGLGRPNHTHPAPGAGQLPVAAIYERAFNRTAPPSFTFGPGAQFAATRDLIRKKPRAWWQRLQLLCEAEYPSTFPWALERLWAALLLEPL